MFLCLRHLVSPIAAFVVILAMGMATPARADLEIWISERHNPPSGGDVVATGTTGASYSNSNFDSNLNILTSGGTTSPGTSTSAQATSSHDYVDQQHRLNDHGVSVGR